MIANDMMTFIKSDIIFFGLGVLILIDAVFVIIMAVIMMSWINFDLTLKVFIPLPFISVLFFCFVKEIG